MAGINNKIKSYVAPDGYVYDYAVPKEDGRHLYAKYLYLSRFDSIDNYVLVEDPYGIEIKD